MITDHEQVIFAAMGFAWMAARFAAEPETWPVFERWARSIPGPPMPPEMTRDLALTLIDELGVGLAVTEEMTHQ